MNPWTCLHPWGSVSKVGGVVNDLYVSRVQDLRMKALQSLFLLLGLAPSFLAALPLVKSESRAPLEK